MRIRNSSGSESKSLFCNLDEIFALHPSPLTQTAHPHRVASVILFVIFVVWLLSNEDIGSYRAIRRV